MVIIYGSALAPHLEITVMHNRYCRVSDVYSGQRLLLSFVPGTFIGACATFAGQGAGNWCYLRWRFGWYLVTQ
ncbi:hypothetical protein ACNKHX_06415 [Shigella flexneri]